MKIHLIAADGQPLFILVASSFVVGYKSAAWVSDSTTWLTGKGCPDGDREIARKGPEAIIRDAYMISRSIK